MGANGDRNVANARQPGNGELDPRYLDFFDCFNRQEFFQAHEALEKLWLGDRGGARDLFFRGLIQVAGAFVHLQKDRLKPAASLFRLARANLGNYPAVYERLALRQVQQLIQECLETLESSACTRNPLSGGDPPRLRLNPPEHEPGS